MNVFGGTESDKKFNISDDAPCQIITITKYYVRQVNDDGTLGTIILEKTSKIESISDVMTKKECIKQCQEITKIP